MSQYATEREILEDGLSHARSSLWRAALLGSIKSGLADVAIFFAPAGVICAIGIIADREQWITQTLLHLILLFCAAGLGLVSARQIVRALRQTPGFAETAERLDLANEDKNQIATALHLVETQDHSAFARLAIAKGLNQLSAYRETKPVMPLDHFAIKHFLQPLVIALALLSIAILVPIRAMDRRSSHGVSSIALEHAMIDLQNNKPAPGDLPHPHDDRTIDLQKSPASNQTTQGADAGKPGNVPAHSQSPTLAGAQASSNSQQAQSAGQSSGLPGDSAAVAGASPSPQPAKQATEIASAEQQEKHGNSARHSMMQANGASAGAANSGMSGPDQQAGAQKAAASKESATGQKQSKSGDVQQGLEGKLGTGKPQYGQGGNGGGSGEGRGNGAPPKKSRGVPPLLLGVPLPDQLQARESAGPDERKMAEVPPQAQPGELAPDSSAAPRTGDEPISNSYNVPPAMRSVVNDYFRQLHIDAEQK